ncbi:MAG: glycerol-3-phosphate cytidylyltransferase [Candidatus Sumerlaea sp.]|nr:D-glycero-beta-D-manno-heptose 1-phosphate adenylyltransferase [Candidatus Sumerlaea chitinivorans]GIX44014.1 MAG: glycerol-3-phosphate cytidylyltransferase [Candidatus Sumerlaea sp.]
MKYSKESHVEGVLSWEEARDRIAELQAQDKKVVFTNGVFDLIHPGHICYLREARALGDALIVALNSDESVQRIKGSLRPILPLVERARLIGALEMVDMVTAFDEDTPLEVIRALQPDILVKGGDYSPDQVVGKDFVESYGGKCLTLSLVEGVSTTTIIQRILRSAQIAKSK